VDSFELQMQNFVDAVAGRTTPMNSAGQAVYLMEMLDAIYLSSSTGREVPIARA
jgi:predicted dehydrogenase